MRNDFTFPRLFLASAALIVLAACGSPESRERRFLEKGRAYVSQGNFEKARVEFRNAMQVLPNEPEARYESGFVAERLGKQREALQLYQSALDVRPDYIDASMRLARLYLLGGAPDRAADILKPALERHPDEPKLLTIRAGVRAQQKDLAGALQDAERAYKLQPDSEDTVAVLAGLYNSSSRPDEAQRTLEAGIARQPKSVDLRLALVQLYLAVNRRDDAEKILKELITLQPDRPEGVLRLARFYAQTDKVPEAEKALRDGIKANESSVPLKLALVQLLAVRKSKDAAEAELQAQVAANPKVPELKFALADFYTETGQVPKAESVLKELIAADGRKEAGVAAKNSLARLKIGQGDLATARSLVGEVLVTSPRDIDALSMRADLELAANDPKGAIADIRAVLRDRPGSSTAIRALARAHIMGNEPAQAEDVLRRAVEAYPADKMIALALIDVLASEGKPDQARLFAENLAKSSPKDATALSSLFRVQMLQKDFAGAHATAAVAKSNLPDLVLGDFLEGGVNEVEGNAAAALDSYSKAIDRAPNAEDVLTAYARLAVRDKKTAILRSRLTKITTDTPSISQAWQLLGELNLGEHRFPDAGADFSKAIELAPKRLAGYRGLSLAKRAAGDLDGAVAVLRDAAEHVPNREEALFEIAAAYQQSNQLEQARKAYEEVLAAKPGYEAAANNLAMLLASRADQPSLDRAKALSTPFATSANPRYVDTYAWVLTARGEYAEAVSALSKIVAQHPAEPSFRYHLALAQIKSGQTDAGRSNLAQVVKSGARFEGEADARALFETLGKS